MVTTSSDDVADSLRLLRIHLHLSKYEHHVIGYNGRLDEIQAAMLRVKFRYLEDGTADAGSWPHVQRAPGDLRWSPPAKPVAQHVYHLYPTYESATSSPSPGRARIAIPST